MPPLAVITEHLDALCADWLAQHARVVWARHDQPEQLNAHLPHAHALVVRTYTQVNADLLDRAPNLKVVGRAGVGLDNIDLDACQARRIAVVYTPDANTQAVVEYILALVFDELRPRAAMPQPVSADAFHQMRNNLVGAQLDQLTLGILGFGRIGKRLGKAAWALGVKLLVNDLIPERDLRPLVDYPCQFVDKSTLYRDSDILTVHVDGRASNRHLINAATLAQLKPTCLFINASRGMVVDPAAMATWAYAHPDARILLDVHDPEPPPATGYPLWGVANVKLLPHLASRTDTAMQNMSWVVRDVAAVLEGQAPQYPAP